MWIVNSALCQTDAVQSKKYLIGGELMPKCYWRESCRKGLSARRQRAWNDARRMRRDCYCTMNDDRSEDLEEVVSLSLLRGWTLSRHGGRLWVLFADSSEGGGLWDRRNLTLTPTARKGFTMLLS